MLKRRSSMPILSFLGLFSSLRLCLLWRFLMLSLLPVLAPVTVWAFVDTPIPASSHSNANNTSLKSAFASHGSMSQQAYLAVATILPWGDLIKGVCGTRCNVKVLLPPGATPHSWSPQPHDIMAIKKARLFCFTSTSLEPWARDFSGDFRANGMAVVEAVNILRQSAVYDPHLWLDFSFDMLFVGHIKRALKEIDPSYGDYYEKRASSLMRRLSKLDRDYASTLSACSHRTIVLAGHNAFKRLAARYGLNVASVMGISPDAHITARTLLRIIDLVKEKNIPYIFFETTSSDKIARTISEATNAKIIPITVGVTGDISRGEGGLNFISLMYDNLNALSTGLGCHGHK